MAGLACIISSTLVVVERVQSKLEILSWTSITRQSLMNTPREMCTQLSTKRQGGKNAHPNRHTQTTREAKLCIQMSLESARQAKACPQFCQENAREAKMNIRMG